MYAARADLVEAFGSDNVDRLSIRHDADGGADDGSEAVTRALTYADGLIDAALSVRFSLPLAAVPMILTAIACDLAMARLASADAAQLTDDLKHREKQARADLRAISEGQMNLGLPSVHQGERPQPIVASTGGKLFTRDRLRGF